MIPEDKLTNDSLPLFPLGIIVMPGETRFLHIFEKRYKNLFEDLEKSGNVFGIPFMADGKMEAIGSLVRFERALAKYPNGEVDIAVRGIDIVSLERFHAGHCERLYPYGSVKRMNKNGVTASEMLYEVFGKYNEKVLKLDLEKYPRMSFYLMANSIGLTDREKYDLLIRDGDKALNKTLINYIKLRTIIASQQNSLQEYFCLN